MALLSTLVDNFDTAGSIDSAKWTFSNLGLSGSASYSSGKLLMNLGTTSAYTGECHLTALANYDTTGDGCYIKLVNKVEPSRTVAGLRVETSGNANDFVEMYAAEDGLIYCLGVGNGSAVWGGTVTYSATTHAWWRIRESAGTFYIDAAPDNSGSPGTWANLFNGTVASMGWTGVKTSVKAHIYDRVLVSGASSVPVHEWDGFNTVSGTGAGGGVNATFSPTEATTADTFAASSTLKVAATFAATGTGSDVFQANVTSIAIRNATFAVTEANTPDTFSANAFGGTARSASMAAAETGADTFAATGTRGAVGLPPYQPPQSTADFIAWLKTSDSAKCLLVEVDVLVGGSVQTLYMSSTGYVTAPTDTPANTIYHSDIIGGCTVEDEIALSYSTSLTLGDVEVSNVNGVHDDWFGYVWKNRPVRFYLGDMRWLRADFRLVFSGTCHDIGSRDRNIINVVMSDKLQRLNQSVSSALLGGTTTNKDKLIPLCFGECSNVSPLLINPATLQYQVHNGPIQDIVEVRDEGVPVLFNKDVTTGKFTLVASPAGRITCTVQGDKYLGTYAQTPANIIKRLATGFGTNPFNNGDIDTNNFDTFNALNTQKMGIYLENRENILDVCNTLAASIAASVSLDGTGKLRLTKFSATVPSATVQSINESHIIAKSFEVLDRVEVQPAVKLAYCRNWTPQPGLQSGIPDAHKALWADDWMTITVADAAQCATYSLPTQPSDQIDTYLIIGTEANAEANSRIALWGVPRTIYGFQAFPELLLLELGDWITITHSRFEFLNGKSAMVLGYEKDWLNCRINLKVLV